jgi:transcriptional regulator with XRE-family HTH domain
MSRDDSGSIDNELSDGHEGEDLATRIRDERHYIGLSQADVAEALGIPRAAVSALETGRRRVSGLELKRLAELFGTSVDRLLGRESEQDETTAALFRATKTMTEKDREQVLRFAEFLRGAGQAPPVSLPNQGDE